MSATGILSSLSGTTGSVFSSTASDILHSRSSSTLGGSALTTGAAASTDNSYSLKDALLALASDATYTNLSLMLAAQQGTDYDPDAGKSKYLAAKLDSFQVTNQMDAARQSEILGSLDQFKGFAEKIGQSTGAKRVAAEVTLREQVKRTLHGQQNEQVVEDADAKFKEERAETDRAAEEARAPKDAEGNPIVVDGHADGSTPRAKDAAGNPVAAGSNGVESLLRSAGQSAEQTDQDAAKAGQAGQAGQPETGDTGGGQGGEDGSTAAADTGDGTAGSTARQSETIGDASLAMAATAAQRYTTTMGGGVTTGQQGGAAGQTGGAAGHAGSSVHRAV